MFIWSLLSDKMTTFSNISENGEWEPWKQWSSCSVTCGKGHMYRSRRCNYPNLPGVDSSCNSKAMELRECTSNDCAGTYKNKRFIIQPISKHNLLLKRRFMHMLQLMVNSHCIESTKGIHATKQWFTSREL